MSLSSGHLLVVCSAGGRPQRTVRGNPATASRTRPGSAPVTVMTSRPCSYAAVARASGQARRGQRLGDGADGGVGGQRGLELLAHRGDRDGVDLVDVLGPGGGLIDGGGGPGQQAGLVEPAGAGRDDVGDRDLAGVPVRAADSRGGGYGGVSQQRILDDPGVDVVTAADDEVLGPAGEVDEPAGVDPAEVAGVQPAVPDDAVPAHPRGAQSRVGDVPGEHGGPADHQHAGLAGAAVGPRPVAADLDGLDLLAGQGAADRPGAFLARPGPGAGAGGLGEPVALQQGPPGVSSEGLADRGRQRGRAYDRQPQRGDVGVDRDLGQRAVDGGHSGHLGDLVVLDDLPEPGVQGRVAVARRARPHHPGTADHRRDAGHDQRVDVEQRQPAQHPLPGRQPGALGDAAGAGELVGVGVRGDLRGAGGPAGVDERGQIAGRRPGGGQVAGWLPGDHLVQVGHGQRAAVRRTTGRGVTVEGGRGAVRAVGPQRQDGGHPRLAGYPEQPLPQLRVQLRPGRDQDP